MKKSFEKYGYKLHDGDYGWLAGLLGAMMLNLAYRENRKLYKLHLAELGIKARGI